MKLTPFIYTVMLTLPAAAAFAAPVFNGGNQNAAAPDLLTGDTRLACEAILCLSSGERPSECDPALKRFFSISHKRWRDTLKARKDFLNLCPASNENEGMRRLTNAIAEGAGRCDANELNRVMRATYRERRCSYYQRDSGNNCTIRNIPYIRNAKPSYCTAYFNHEWTVLGDSVRYVGEEKKGGRWVDVK